MTGALLYVVHVCMRGEDDLVEGELYKGQLRGMLLMKHLVWQRMMVCM